MGQHQDRAQHRDSLTLRTYRRDRIERVVLTGFMGAGKSTVGALLAPLLGWVFIDVDAVLCERSGLSIAELFRRDGEARFRLSEAALIEELISHTDTVLALGGGALEHADTMHRLISNPATMLVYLEVPLSVAIERCVNEPCAAERPVLADRVRLEARFAAREPLYRQAHRTLATEGRPPKLIAAEIAAALQGQ